MSSPGRPKTVPKDIIHEIVKLKPTRTWKQVGKELGINPSTAAVLYHKWKHPEKEAPK